MTKTQQFLVPSSKKKNLNNIVSKMFEKSDLAKKLDGNTVRVENSTPLKTRARATAISVSGATCLDAPNLGVNRSEANKTHLRKVMRYLKRKLWEKGYKNANIYVSAETLQKISEKLLQSESMGSDQN